MVENQQIRSNWFDTLETKSLWNSAQKINYKDSANFIVVPISTQPITPNFGASKLSLPNNNTRQYLLFTIDNNSIIKQASIVQLNPIGSIRESNIALLISKIFKNVNVDYDGAIGIFTLQKQFVFQFNYENQSRVSQTVLQTQDGLQIANSTLVKTHNKTMSDLKSLNNKAISFPINDKSNILTLFGDGQEKKVNSQVCINWYLVTTMADGSQDWLYLFQTCTDNCEQTSITPKGEIYRIKIACRGSGGGSGGCNYSDSDGAYLISSAHSETLSPASTMVFDQPFDNPSTGRYEKFGNTPPANFLTISFSPLGMSLYSATYSAFYGSKVYKNANSSYERWKWASVNFTNQVSMTLGALPPCTGVTLTTSDYGTIISPDELTASSKLYYSWYPVINCVSTVQVGSTTTGVVDFFWGSATPSY